MTLSELIKPISVSEFFEKNWMKEPLHIAGGNGFEDMFNIETINDFLSRTVLTYPFIRLVGKGIELPLTEYIISVNNTFNVLNKERVFQLFEEGNTIVIQGAQYHFQELNDFTTRLATELKGDINANIYITPSGTHGFDPHFDAHEVIVLQVFGTKMWRLYDKDCNYPLKDWKLTPAKQKEYMKSNPTHEISVCAGDILYVPAGVVHDAYCEDDLSIHITLGIKSPTKLNYLEKAIKEAEKLDFFRAPLDSSPAGLEAIKENFTKLLDNIVGIVNKKQEKDKLPENLFIDYCCVENIERLDSSDFIVNNDAFVPASNQETSLISFIKERKIVEFFEELGGQDKKEYKKSLKTLLRKDAIKLRY